MMTVKKGSAIFAAALIIGACASGFDAMYDHDRSNDFSAYKSYAWISEHPMQVGVVAQVPNPLLEGRIKSAIETALAAKGYSKVGQPSSADFVLSFTVGSREEIKVDSYPSMSGGAAYGRPGHWGWGGAYYGYGTETTVRQYTKGMLAIDIFDVSDRKPVWHGVAEKTIHEADRAAVEGTIKAAVDTILTGFPPQ
jgi:hypothetical protein